MNEEIQKIKEAIEVINHNSTKIEASLKSVCESLKELQLNLSDHLEDFSKLQVVLGQVQENINWLKKLTWWILTTILMGTLLSIFGGLIFLFLK